MGVLDGEVARVRGASTGIGAGIAQGSASGASVVVNYASSAPCAAGKNSFMSPPAPTSWTLWLWQRTCYGRYAPEGSE